MTGHTEGTLTAGMQLAGELSEGIPYNRRVQLLIAL